MLKFVFELESSVTVTVAANVAVAALPEVSAAVESVCVVTNV